MHVWRERLARWLTPLARRCPVSPNTITTTALLINLAAAGFLAAGKRDPIFFLIAVVLLIAGGIADAFDGIVARVQEKSTRFGDFLDHVADRISDTAIAAGWLAGSGVREEITIPTLILVMLNGYMGTQIEATWGERNYESVGRGEFVLAMVAFPIGSFILYDNGWASERYGTFTIAEWMALVLVVFALLGIVQRLALARRMERSS